MIHAVTRYGTLSTSITLASTRPVQTRGTISYHPGWCGGHCGRGGVHGETLPALSLSLSAPFTACRVVFRPPL